MRKKLRLRPSRDPEWPQLIPPAVPPKSPILDQWDTFTAPQIAQEIAEHADAMARVLAEREAEGTLPLLDQKMRRRARRSPTSRLRRGA